MQKRRIQYLSIIIICVISLFCKDDSVSIIQSISKLKRVPAQYSTIQQAIDAAISSDTVLVAPGVYKQNIDFKGKSIVVKSSGGIIATTIEGDSTKSVVTFNTGEANEAVLEGFTIIRGSNSGILCDSNSSPTLKKLKLTRNYGFGGGGISCYLYSNPNIQQVTIVGNKAVYGGGIGCSFSSSPRLKNVIISDNTAQDGGGIACWEASNPQLQNVLIVKNFAVYGGGVANYFSSSPTFFNVTIADNISSTYTGGICSNGGFSISLISCIISGNRGAQIEFTDVNDPNYISISFSSIQGGKEGIVTNNNGFINWSFGSGWYVPQFNIDYTLGVHSDCRNAGAIGSFYNDPDGSPNDMGAFGGPFADDF